MPRSRLQETDFDEALALMHFAFRAMIARPDSILARHGLGRVHHRVLFFLRREQPCSVGHLAGVLRVTRQALNRPLRDLLRRKLIAGLPLEQDRRQRSLSLTAAGARLESSLSGDQRDRFAKAFKQLGGPHERAWRAVMREIAGPLWATPAASVPRSGAKAQARRQRPR